MDEAEGRALAPARHPLRERVQVARRGVRGQADALPQARDREDVVVEPKPVAGAEAAEVRDAPAPRGRNPVRTTPERPSGARPRRNARDHPPDSSAGLAITYPGCSPVRISATASSNVPPGRSHSAGFRTGGERADGAPAAVAGLAEIVVDVHHAGRHAGDIERRVGHLAAAALIDQRDELLGAPEAEAGQQEEPALADGLRGAVDQPSAAPARAHAGSGDPPPDRVGRRRRWTP